MRDATGLEAGEVKLGEMPAYSARPAQGTSFPIVLVVHEIFGLHDYIQDVCRRLARQGFLAVAPDLYARQGGVSQLSNIQEIISKVVSRVPDEQVLSDLDAAALWAASKLGDAGRLGITGFCWGGRIVWLYAAHNPNLKAAVAWYGQLTRPGDQLHPSNPLDAAGSLLAPVLGLYGGQDQSIPLHTVEVMRTRLKAASSPSEIIVYPEAPHAFHNNRRPNYRPGPAEQGWNRMLEWFGQHGLW